MSPTPQVRLRGLVGAALAANHTGRLSRFIVDENSPAIAMFAPAHRATNVAGDWYGEHAGKWLYAAARAAARTDDAVLRDRVLRVADYLVSVQEADGYLGTYAPERRFMHRQAPKPKSWDGAPTLRTWDIWVHAYLVLGLLEVHRRFPSNLYLAAARRIGDLCWHTLTDGGIDITDLGNHHGMSATVLMDPAVELYRATGARRYLDLASLVLEQAERNPDLALLSSATADVDASAIGTGKAYQLLWNMVGVAKLYRATGTVAYRTAVERVWLNVRTHHLTLGGGPWGGVGHRSREVFNAAGSFSPYGYVETCSVLAWIQLNGELLALSGDGRYAGEIERAAYNDLIGAQAPDGENWCYYSFPNGRRVHTTYWRCCKSSGAMALEEMPELACAVTADGALRIHLYGPAEAVASLPQVGTVHLAQRTDYPFDGTITIGVRPERVVRFTILLRMPEWVGASRLEVCGEALPCLVRPDGYVAVDRVWKAADEIVLSLDMPPVVHRAVHRNVQESRAPGDSLVRQEVLHHGYAAITRGPLVYATGLVDGFKTEESLHLPDAPEEEWLELLEPEADDAGGPSIRMHPDHRPPLVFTPYYRTGGRADGAWRLTWWSLGATG